ncbi:MAG TPA: hypothetical protein VGO55_01050 [Allosphingosinicella sp.]|jgi:hypothetical protein|nr:hypothetical protein [Allosphingosinicella sp.]
MNAINPWPFIAAAYALTLLGTAGLALWSFLAMRRAEADADAVSKRP